MNTYVFTTTVEVDAESDEEAWEKLHIFLDNVEKQADLLNGNDWWMEEEILDINND